MGTNTDEQEQQRAQQPPPPDDPTKKKTTTKQQQYAVLSEEEVIAMTQITEGGIGESALYMSGIGTLRSSSHRVKANPKSRKQNPKPKNRLGQQTNTTDLPPSLYEEQIIPFDMSKYNLRQAFTDLLLKRCRQSCNGDDDDDDNNEKEDEENMIVGSFRNPQQPVLEDFVLPVNTLNRKCNGGRLEKTQAIMSQAVAEDPKFLELFDRLVEEVILDHLKQRLMDATTGSILKKDDKDDVQDPSSPPPPEEQKISFYVQRPPTVRVQPGPGRTGVKPHHDGEYGHQNGELNFWLPLTNREMTQVDLWCETSHKANDYHPIPAGVGEIISFHGSSCRHFVNRNDSSSTRVSLDFRIGVEGYFDPCWAMKGTTHDHGRKEIRR